MPRTRTRTLRTQVRNAIAAIVVTAVLLFGIPLAVVLGRLIESRALTGLQRDATRAVAGVPDNVLQRGSAVRVPAGSSGTRIGVYDAQGSVVAGRGPVRSALAARAGDGREHDAHDGGDLAVVVPVLSDTTVAGSVRAAVPLTTLRGRVAQAWGLLAALALAVIAVAIPLARRAARRISSPFEQITAAARNLGAGNYQLDLVPSGIAEADAAGEALRDSAIRIDQLVAHERTFVRDASHQLRTPLAGLLLHLEREPPDLPAALAGAQHLQTTIADLLALRSVTARGSCSPYDVAAQAVRRWSTAARPVTLRADTRQPVAITAPALRQSLDVLLDNAIRHGAGEVTVTVEPLGEDVVVEVADHGPGFSDADVPGTGLSLATDIVERAGGALLIRRRAPHARIALLLKPTLAQPPSTSNR